MKISNYNQLLAISTLISGMIIFLALWSQYQKVEKITRKHYESRLLVQTVDHLFTMSQIWLTTQDLLFSGRQTYLANGISKQSKLLTETLLMVKQKVPDNTTSDLAQELIAAIKKNDVIVNSFSHLSMQNTQAWQNTIIESDDVTSRYISVLNTILTHVLLNDRHLSNELRLATVNFTQLTWVVISLYLLTVFFTVTWFSKYIVKPIENIITLAQQPVGMLTNIQFRQANAPIEVVALSSAIQKFTQSITKEKQKAEQEGNNAVRANEKANAIMDTMPCSLFLVDEWGAIQECNSESENLLLRSKDKILTKNIGEFIPALWTLGGDFDHETALKSMEESLLSPEFTAQYIEFSGRKITIKGAVNYLITVIDINERKHSQRALSSLNEQLINAEKLASIGQLSAGIAHEINNPVGYIRCNIDVLNEYFKSIVAYIKLVGAYGNNDVAKLMYKNEDLDLVIKDIEPLIGATLEGTARISEIVKDLGNYAHVDKKSPEPIVIDELIEKSLSMVANELKYKVEIIKCLDAKVEIFGFPQKLLQVFINMLVNASHAIESKGSISIYSKTYQHEVRICFEDNGSGITQEHLKDIFNPFFTTKPVGKGTGLGLHIVRSIIEDHHGRINVSSIVGKGSKFDIYLPVHHTEEFITELLCK